MKGRDSMKGRTSERNGLVIEFRLTREDGTEQVSGSTR